jgi:hypothetical protein
VSAQSSAGFFARLGCTRIGSPGIFGERDPKALFTGAKPQVAHERKSVGYQASFPAGHLRLPSHRRGAATTAHGIRIGYGGTGNRTSNSTQGTQQPRAQPVEV